MRDKVDSFFNEKRISAAKELDHEGMLDEHMESMFKPTGQKVEVGQRRIGDEAVTLSGKAYEGKKVSRAQLEEESSSQNDDAEFGEDEMSLAGESMEDDMSESSEQSLKDLDKNA